ncbi:MAG: hypothetical protein KGL35_18595 [Bradyrhizobium sp.]|nr:hypothetical protein [Bradyrhizobium sp.]
MTTTKIETYKVLWHRDGEDAEPVAAGLTLAEAQELIARKVGAEKYVDAGFGGMNEGGEDNCGYYYFEREDA